jgi:hypothetical protein
LIRWFQRLPAVGIGFDSSGSRSGWEWNGE